MTNLKEQETKLVDLALQGGGAHGAFTWGVLDRLLEEPWLEIDGISGTSAGAMNAAVLVDGYMEGGSAGARRALESFWRKVSETALYSPFRRSVFDVLAGQWSLEHSLAFNAVEAMSRLFSPYDLNPGGFNPLKHILDESIDFGRLSNSPIKLFITATNVRTGQGRVFRNTEISSDVLLASACLPTLFHAVEVEGEFYWDGGYSGNPTLTPLIRDGDSDDTILVQVNPVARAATPYSGRDIANRLNEISFNAVLLKELRMMALLRKVTDCGDFGEGARWSRMRLHRIASEAMLAFDYSSKFNAEWEFLSKLRVIGRQTAEDFLSESGTMIGIQSTFPIEELLTHV
ncbi:MAG: patatin-like phospholipase family protein [Alphaproteobacteria bacterium]|nr:patatin-like phospholipase family protein [Alphaproteobacteria bacterium]